MKSEQPPRQRNHARRAAIAGFLQIATGCLGALALSCGSVVAQDNTKSEYEGKLNNIKVTLDFQNAPLDTVIDYLREISGMNIFVDAKVRDKQIVVSLKVTEITLKSIFSLMLKPHECGVHFKDGVLQIMPRSVIDEVTMKMEIYDCRDILYPIQQFPGDHRGLDGLAHADVIGYQQPNRIEP